MGRYRWGLYFSLVVLMVADGLIVTKLIQNSRKPVAPSPAVLGQTTIPINSRGTAPGEQKKPPVPTPAKTLDFHEVSAKSFLVYDANSGITLAERASSQKIAIASLTKLMTALVVYNTLRFDDTVTVSAEDLVSEDPALNLQVGDAVKIGDLFNAMLIGSANDAASALARAVEKIEGTAFPIIMNNRARRLGMFGTNFSNPLGFDSQNNFSSAHDLSLLVNAARSYTAFQLVGRSTSYGFTSSAGRQYSITATNKLVAADSEISAIKTGYTLEAQGAMITAAAHDGHVIILIVLGSANREQDTLVLKKIIFDSYVWQP